VSAIMAIAWPCPSSVEQYAAARRGCPVLTARRFRAHPHTLAAGLCAPAVEPGAAAPTAPTGGELADPAVRRSAPRPAPGAHLAVSVGSSSSKQGRPRGAQARLPGIVELICPCWSAGSLRTACLTVCPAEEQGRHGAKPRSTRYVVCLVGGQPPLPVWNQRRLDGAIGNVPPAAHEAISYHQHQESQRGPRSPTVPISTNRRAVQGADPPCR
jgi:hypothetical protein